MHPIRLFLLTILSILVITGCSEDKSTSPADSTGTLKILLTDAPSKFDQINITFSEISVHSSDDSAEDEQTNGEGTDGNSEDQGSLSKKSAGEWIVINNETQTFDLLTLTNGITSILGEKELEAGHYTQIRLQITEAEIVVDGTTYQLTIPSGTVKFVSGFDIVSETSTELIIDFDAARSVHTTGGNKSEYKLRPTIRLINKALCGSISGQVTNYENLPVAYAIAGSDTLNSTYVNENNGKFTLGFLPEGTYEVSVADTLDQKYLNQDVSVIIGTKTELGNITLE